MRNWLQRLMGGSRASTDLAPAMRRLQEIDRRLAAMDAALAERATSKDSLEILHGLKSVERALRSRLGREDDRERPERWLYRALDELAASSAPVIVGPWTGEVGFEVLYWIPFLRWACARWRIAENRLVIVSRGGVEGWYAMPAARYVDIFGLVGADEFRAGTDPDEHKQRDVSAFEAAIVAKVTDRLSVQGAQLLHPGLMYRAFAPFWRDEEGFAVVERFTDHRVIAAPAPAAGAPVLPSSFAAARFYFSDAFPDTAANRGFARAAVQALAATTPVVLLDPGVKVDDHDDLDLSGIPNVSRMSGAVPLDQNLTVQSAVLSRASVFVGTYGGYSYLAPFYGVPALAFYSDRKFKQHHLFAAHRVFEKLGTATLVSLDIANAGVASLLGAANSHRQSFVEDARRVGGGR
jgi:hypothetical protein